MPQGYEVLDIGTGTGAWAIEFARENPHSRVTGVDLSPVQPQTTPENCHFQVGDVEADWAFDLAFDFIHGRFLTMGIRNWPRIFEQSFAHLKPGGWAEYQEATFLFPTDPTSTKPNPEMHSLVEDVGETTKKLNVDIRQAPTWKPALEAAGFVNHRMVCLRWPIGEWSGDPKEKMIGKLTRLNILNAIEGLTLAYLVRVRGDKEEDVRVRLDKAREELRDEQVHMYMSL